MPVASGSRLPTCPAFSRPNRPRTRCRAAFDDRPRGLSSSRMPLGMRDACSARWAIDVVRRRRRRRRGRIARLCGRSGAIVRHRLVDEVREVCGGLDTLVEYEVEPRRMAQPEAPPELTTQEARGVGETRAHLLGSME